MYASAGMGQVPVALDFARAANPVPLPTVSNGGVVEFIRAIKEFLTKCTARLVAADGPIYSAAWVVHKIWLWLCLRRLEDSLFEGLSIRDLRTSSPAKKYILGELPGDMSCKAVGARFDMHPLMVYCWACLFSAVGAD